MLRKCNLFTFSSSFLICFLKSLEVLTLDKNPISSIHPSFIHETNNLNLLSLDALKLDRKLDDIALININNVKGLSLTRNHLTILPPKWASNFSSLILLNLGHNNLADLKRMNDCFVGLEKNLRNLDLHSNHFIEIPSSALKPLLKLTALDLSHNKIKKIKRKSLKNLKTLQNLDLSHNRIEKICKRAFHGMDSLVKLDLRHNHLYTLDERVFKGWRVGGTAGWLNNNNNNNNYAVKQQVYISGNPWLCNCILTWLKRSLQHTHNGKLLSHLSSGERKRKRKHFIGYYSDERYQYNNDNNNNNNNNYNNNYNNNNNNNNNNNDNYNSNNNYYNNNNNYNNNNKYETGGNVLDIFADSAVCNRPSTLKGLPLLKVNEEDLRCDHNYFDYVFDDDVASATTTTTTTTTSTSGVDKYNEGVVGTATATSSGGSGGGSGGNVKY